GERAVRGVAGDEVDPGAAAGLTHHTRDVDTFAFPQIAERGPELVVADMGHVSGRRASPCGGDGGVGGVAAEADGEVWRRGKVMALRSIHLQERLAESDQIHRSDPTVLLDPAAQRP